MAIPIVPATRVYRTQLYLLLVFGAVLLLNTLFYFMPTVFGKATHFSFIHELVWVALPYSLAAGIIASIIYWFANSHPTSGVAFEYFANTLLISLIVFMGANAITFFPKLFGMVQDVYYWIILILSGIGVLFFIYNVFGTRIANWFRTQARRWRTAGLNTFEKILLVILIIIFISCFRTCHLPDYKDVPRPSPEEEKVDKIDQPKEPSKDTLVIIHEPPREPVAPLKPFPIDMFDGEVFDPFKGGNGNDGASNDGANTQQATYDPCEELQYATSPEEVAKFTAECEAKNNKVYIIGVTPLPDDLKQKLGVQ